MPKISLGRQKGCATNESVKSINNICCATAAISYNERINYRMILWTYFVEIIKCFICYNFGLKLQLKLSIFLCYNQKHIKELYVA